MVKANPNTRLLEEICKLGLGADVVSIGELMRALKGISPKKLFFLELVKHLMKLSTLFQKKYFD